MVGFRIWKQEESLKNAVRIATVENVSLLASTVGDRTVFRLNLHISFSPRKILPVSVCMWEVVAFDQATGFWFQICTPTRAFSLVDSGMGS